MRRGNNTQVAKSVPFLNEKEVGGDPIFTESDPKTVQQAIEASGEKGQLALDTPRYTILLQNNGTVSNNTFIGYDSLIPGDSTPVIIPIDSQVLEFTFSNSRSNADYTLEFRKNGTGVATFYTVSKTNTQFFTDNTIDETFDAGDQIYIKYLDDGNNASDAVILLTLKALP